MFADVKADAEWIIKECMAKGDDEAVLQLPLCIFHHNRQSSDFKILPAWGFAENGKNTISQGMTQH